MCGMEHEYHGGKSLGRFLLRKVDHYQIYPLFLQGIFTEQRQWAAQVVAGAIVYMYVSAKLGRPLWQ